MSETRRVTLTTTISANQGIHQNLTQGSTHEARVDTHGRVWVLGYGRMQVLLRPEEYSEVEG